MKKFKIIENIRKLKEISVNSDWLSNGQKNLQGFMAENPVRNFESDRHSWQEGVFKKLILKPMPIAIIAIIASLITGSGIVTASQNSLPTDRLYPVKLIMEKVEEATTFNEIKKVELQTKLATNRLEEIKQLQLQGRATKIIVEDNLQKYQGNLTKAQVYLANINTDKEISWPKAIEVSNNLENEINNQGSFIATIEAGAPVEYKTVLSQKRESVLASSPAIPILSAVSTVTSTSSITAETPTTPSIPTISISSTTTSGSVTPNVTLPIIVTSTVIIPPTVKITPKPIICPDHINCFPEKVKMDDQTLTNITDTCRVQVGCEGLTKIIYY